MNRSIGMALVAVGLVVLQQPAAAENRCRYVRGNLVEVWGGGDNTTGTLSDGRWLNGTTLSVFNSDAYPTPDPNKVTFSSTFSLTTNRGQLEGKARVYLFDLVMGLGTAMVEIDPIASTGVFAGATGLLYTMDLRSTPGPADPPPITYYDVVVGQVCFARRPPQDR